MTYNVRSRLKPLLFLGGLLLSCFHPLGSLAAGFGSLAGMVSDNQGVPLMGATVMVLGPATFATETASQTLERMVTDAHGRFTITHLVPGWYSLKVISPTRLPAMRNGVHVEAGETSVASFVLTDTLTPIRFHVPNNSVSSWGDDWKWVLRTSSTTRPILRYRQQPELGQAASASGTNTPAPRSERVVGVLPGISPVDPFAEDFGLASVIAYLRPLSTDSDVLLAGSLSPSGSDSGSLATVIRRNQLKGEPQEFGVILHQFSLLPGAGAFTGSTPAGFAPARGVVATYSETRLLAPHVTVTAGMDINYLDSVESVLMAQPRVNLEYQATSQTVVSAQYGSHRTDGNGSLTERLGQANSFPQVTQRNGRLEMAQLNHTEVAVNHRMGKSVRVQAAAYHDATRNAPVWGLGQTSSYGQAFLGNALPNSSGAGMVINGGSYRSSGFRVVYAQNLGSHVEVLGAYASGSALSARGFAMQGIQPYSQGVLKPQQTGSALGKLSVDMPVTHTRFSASYAWIPEDRVTSVDPAGLADFRTSPYLGLQVRQPIPTPNCWPVHIDAVAEVQNLLSQGYVPAGQGIPKPLILSSGYHAVRGGFSVQF